MKKINLITIIFCLFVMNLSAQVGGLTVGLFLNKIEKKAKKIINEVESSANGIVNNAAINVFHAVHQFEDAYSSMLNKTMDELTYQEKQIFDGLKERTDDIFYQIENDILGNVENRIDQLGGYLLNLPFAKKVPFISQISSPIIFLNDNRVIRVEIKGQLLNHKDNKVFFKGQELDFTSIDNKITVKIPVTDVFNEKSKCEDYQKITVKCHYEKKKPIAIKKNTVYKTYDFELRAEKSNVGKVKIKYMIQEDNLVPNLRTETVRGSVYCRPLRKMSSNVDLDIFPSKGHYIDINSINLSHRGSEYCDRTSGFVDPKTASKIVLKASGRGERKTNTHCYYSSTVTFNEYPSVTPKRVVNKEIVKDLYYNNPVVVELPNNTKTWKLIEVENCHGNTVKMIKPGVDKSNFIKVEYENETKTIKIETLR